MLPAPFAPKRSQVMLMGAAPSESPEKEIWLTFVAGFTRLPLESNVNVPLAPDDTTGDWITFPDVDIFAPVTFNVPLVLVTFTPVMPAVRIAACSAPAYVATVSPATTVGAVIVAVPPLDVSPVTVKFVVGSTVATVPPLE